MSQVAIKALNERIAVLESIGEVRSYTIRRSVGDHGDDSDGLASVNLFGPTKDYFCCGRQVMQERKNALGETVRRCSRCGREVYPASVREDIRSYIKLNAPIINPILAGDNGRYLALILGIPTEQMEALCTCKGGYDTSTGEFVYLNSLKDLDTQTVLLNGEAARALILDFDWDKAISAEISKILFEAYFSSTAPIVAIGVANKTPSKFHIAQDWYFHFSEDYTLYLKRTVDYELTPELVTNLFRSKVLRSLYSRLSLLFNGNTSKLKEMVMNILRVTPAGMRPEIEQRHDPMTLAYARIVQANGVLGMLRGTDNIIHRAARIEELYKAIHSFMISDDTGKAGRQSVKDSLSHKKGKIRAKINGKRVDWSGRSVIIVDPTVKLGQCSLPYEIAKVIYGFHLAALKIDCNNDAAVRSALENDILQRVPVLLNRAPSLHRLSVQAFIPVLSSKRAIGLHPLVCDGYNADFDGDSMAVHVPLSPQAVLEANSLLLSTNNIYTPGSGAISIVPKQELVYGLYELTRVTSETANGRNIGNADFIDVYRAIISQELAIEDLCTCNGYYDTAGRNAIRHCLPIDMHDNIPVISKSTIGELMRRLVDRSVTIYTECIQRMLDLAFAAATLYAPTISVLDPIDPSINKPFENFFERIAPATEEYENGFECADQYNDIFSREYQAAQKEITNTLVDAIGRNNGYVTMVESGARGDRGNLSQIFVGKGRISKTSSEAFNMIITSSFLEQLNTTEHFIGAYGTRKTLIDKVNKTGDTGDAMRRMSHTTAPRIITSDDCGTHDGIVFSATSVARFLQKDASGHPDLEAAKQVILKFIIGRYEADTGLFITEELAKRRLAEQGSITIRSILTCKNPCCSKCYGVDLTYNRKAVVGTPIGFISSQSIGEPGTQLTMRTFHSGGVTGKADVTSAFDKMKALIDNNSRADFNKFPNYDPIAWVSGEVKVGNTGDKLKVSIGESKKVISLPITAKIKSGTVEKGEGLCIEEGDHDIREVLQILGPDKAQFYLLMSLFSVYNGQANINIKYFEVLVDGMTRFICVNNKPGAEIKIGQALSTYDYAHLSYKSNYTFIKTINGVKEIPRGGSHFLGHMAYAYLADVLFMSNYLESKDNLEEPYSRILFGLPPKAGTYYPTYLGERDAALSEQSLMS